MSPSKTISVTHSSQSRTYWCGPSAVAMALRTIGVTSPTQTVLAGQLKTTTAGTAWSGVNVSTSPSTGRPVKDVLNNRTGRLPTMWRLTCPIARLQLRRRTTRIG
ncbi:C39 family peptidase [Aeromicrobium sp. UC242_57]|uniref:C39 family peptidase n=1 Tax=Aeromicrobium sp. UC242_57 TaxID=3374624 RepID=UPI00379BECC1